MSVILSALVRLHDLYEDEPQIAHHGLRAPPNTPTIPGTFIHHSRSPLELAAYIDNDDDEYTLHYVQWPLCQHPVLADLQPRPWNMCYACKAIDGARVALSKYLSPIMAALIRQFFNPPPVPERPESLYDYSLERIYYTIVPRPVRAWSIERGGGGPPRFILAPSDIA